MCVRAVGAVTMTSPVLDRAAVGECLAIWSGNAAPSLRFIPLDHAHCRLEPAQRAGDRARGRCNPYGPQPRRPRNRPHHHRAGTPPSDRPPRAVNNISTLRRPGRLTTSRCLSARAGTRRWWAKRVGTPGASDRRRDDAGARPRSDRASDVATCWARSDRVLLSTFRPASVGRTGNPP